MINLLKNRLTPKSRRRPAQSQPETLETRTLLSNVSVSIKKGDLIVQGDNANNRVRLVGNGNGTVIVSGLSGTTVNGSMYSQSFRVRDDVRLAFNKGGNNKVLLDRVDADDLSYKGGHGRDELGVRYGSLNDVSVKTAGGNDKVLFQFVDGIDSMNINTGHGRDDIGIASAGRSLNINSGHGHDSVLVVSPQDNATIKTSGGNDYVALYNTRFSGNVKVQTGHGADELWVVGTTIGGTLNAHGGGDSDAEMIEVSSIGSTSLKSFEFDSIDNAYGKALDASDRLTAIWLY